ncbi:putative cytokinetic ring protein SteA [Desulfallas thermosapovorans]|uniref:Putative membrane-anchored protein n=1 Tax=Desulfallas thermosapovorans DSM 6562 TaxID=1121431 RepID=A0A5S4ZU43_9FIRM|nr:putative cytokinetic ring protein SteA [Desulfallas thermosapovorans]TYO95610.1 putative membrane-anchored protein [Desulfallas thermosapovorans DSM 6562]
MAIKGTVRLDKKTKHLVKRLQHGDIAVIDHRDLDEVAANALVEAHVKAVVNVSSSMSEVYPNCGPLTIVEAGIKLVDCPESDLFSILTEGQEIEVKNGQIIHAGRVLCSGEELTVDIIKQKMEATKANLESVLSSFVQNTMDYAQNEIGLICGQYKVPDVKTTFKDKHALIVVRGKNYKEDLRAIKSYIYEIKPVLIGVDGGADALMEFGLKPDVIVGDMDSVSDKTLQCGAELVVHAYPDGRAPGMARLQEMGLPAITFAAPGTSEDIAMLIAYEKGAELIVAVGTHSNMIDFLEKGRKGMASTFLVRAKVGSVLIDAKGVSKLYKSRLRAKHLAPIFVAAMLPVAAVAVISPSTRELLRLLFIQFRLLVGI